MKFYFIILFYPIYLETDLIFPIASFIFFVFLIFPVCVESVELSKISSIIPVGSTIGVTSDLKNYYNKIIK